MPSYVAAIVERLLEKKPADRYRSAAVVADLLERALAKYEHDLREKGLSFHVQTLDLAAGGQRESGFAQASITRRVPTLVDDGFVLSESTAILDYLEACFPAPALVPADVQGRALVAYDPNIRLNVEPRLAVWREHIEWMLPRTQLLKRHRERVENGEPSVIFGMQSFGEGLDLPGRLCESVFITKLPFAPPDDPVGEARAEWLRAVGRDPFSELVVPATAIRLAQWVGRAIRTEEDMAHVYCYDKRLTRTSYGQRLLKGLPPFALEQRAPL